MSMPIISFENAAGLLSEERARYLLFGSAISRPSPSNLPTVSDIKGAFVRNCLTERLCEAADNRRRLEDQVVRTFTGIPFEMMIEGLGYSTGFDTTIPLRLLFGNGPPNELHRLIGRLLTSRILAGVITTNFDTLLEQAMVNEVHSLDRFCVVANDEDYAEVLQRDDSIVPLIKIHGSLEAHHGSDLPIAEESDQLKGLVHTLRQVSRGLPKEKVKCLKHLFGGRALLLVVGYGGNDLDIQEGINEILEDAEDLTIIWCCRNPQRLNSVIIRTTEMYPDSIKILPEVDLTRRSHNPLCLLPNFESAFPYALIEDPPQLQALEDWLAQMPDKLKEDFIYWVTTEWGVHGPVLNTVEGRIRNLPSAATDHKEELELRFYQGRAYAGEHRYFEARVVFNQTRLELEELSLNERTPFWVNILKAKIISYQAYSARMQFEYMDADSYVDEDLELFNSLYLTRPDDIAARTMSERLRAEIWIVMSRDRTQILCDKSRGSIQRLRNASRLLQELIEKSRDDGQFMQYAHAIRLKGKCELALGNLTEAEFLLGAFLLNMDRCGTETLRGNARRNLAIVRLCKKELSSARNLVDQAADCLSRALESGMTEKKIRLERVKLLHVGALIDACNAKPDSDNTREGMELAVKLEENDPYMSSAYIRYFTEVEATAEEILRQI